MSEKRIGAFLFLVMLLVGIFFHSSLLAETSGDGRLVLFEVFRNYTDVDELDDGLSATFQSGVGYGVLFATFITLLLIPSLYLILDDIHNFTARIKDKISPSRVR